MEGKVQQPRGAGRAAPVCVAMRYKDAAAPLRGAKGFVCLYFTHLKTTDQKPRSQALTIPGPRHKTQDHTPSTSQIPQCAPLALLRAGPPSSSTPSSSSTSRTKSLRGQRHSGQKSQPLRLPHQTPPRPGTPVIRTWSISPGRTGGSRLMPAASSASRRTSEPGEAHQELPPPGTGKKTAFFFCNSGNWVGYRSSSEQLLRGV
jgi:hypothetical protein